MRSFILTMLLSAACFAQDFTRHVGSDGVARAYVEVDTALLSQPMDTNLFPSAVAVTGYDGETAITAPLTVGNAVLTHLIRDLGNGRTVLPLALISSPVYRDTRCDTNELSRWWQFLSPLGYTNFLTVAELHAAYPQEETP